MPRKHYRALVMLSGGLDSAVALYWALEKGYSIETITFDYFLRSAREKESAERLSKTAGCPMHNFDLGFLKEIEDTENRNPELKDAPSAYIPSRNLIFYGIASSIAEYLDAKYLVGGHNRDDVESFPDASPEFFEEFNNITTLGLRTGSRTGRVVLPLAQMSKAQVLVAGKRLKVPFEDTWSCYKSGEKPCGKCPACALRASAFNLAGLEDPLITSSEF